MYIFVSRLRNNCDYDSLLSEIVKNNTKTYNHDNIPIDYKYNCDNKTIVIKGKRLLTCVEGFDNYFMVPDKEFRQDTNKEIVMASKLQDIITKIIKMILNLMNL